MTGSRFVDMTPWLGGEWEKACVVCRGWVELSETALIISWFEWRFSNFSWKPNIAKLLFLWPKVCFSWLTEIEVVHRQFHMKGSLVLCVYWWCCQTGVALERVQILFSWGIKNSFLTLLGLVQTLVNLTFHLSTWVGDWKFKGLMLFTGEDSKRS